MKVKDKSNSAETKSDTPEESLLQLITLHLKLMQKPQQRL